MKDHCYEGDLYYVDDKKRVAILFEHCNEFALKYYDRELTKAFFIERFMNSEFRSVMDLGHPAYHSQAAEDTFKEFVEVEGGIVPFYRYNDTNDYAYHELFWIGQMYSYAHFKTRKSSRFLWSRLPLREMRHYYVTGHQMSLPNAFERIKDAFCTEDRNKTILTDIKVFR